MDLGFHFVRSAVREFKTRHAKFLRIWIRINYLCDELRRYVIANPWTDNDAANENRLATVESYRSTLLSQCHRPQMDFDHKLVLPLYRVIRESKRIGGHTNPGKTAFVNQTSKQLNAEIKQVRDFYMQEFKLMTGKDLEPDTDATSMAFYDQPSTLSLFSRPDDTLPPAIPTFFTSPLAETLGVSWDDKAAAASAPPEPQDTDFEDHSSLRFSLPEHLARISSSTASLNVILEREDKFWFKKNAERNRRKRQARMEAKAKRRAQHQVTEAMDSVQFEQQ